MWLLVSFKENNVLKLNQPLYGFRDSTRNFIKHLKGKLEKCDFVQGTPDPCLCIGPKVICVVYVDNCLFFYHSQSDTDQENENIRQTGMTLNIEDNIAGFLEVHKNYAENGCVTLNQKGLIDRIFIATQLEDSNPNNTPSP